jgi:hypothetical protein
MAVILVSGVAALSARGEQGTDKAPWQPVLTKEAYQELANREAELIKNLLDNNPDDDALHRARFGAALIAAYTMSVKGDNSAEELRGVRERAVLLAQVLGKKGDVAAAKKLLDGLLTQKTNPQAALRFDWDKLIENRADLMLHLHVKAKGGDGMHADLQSNARLKGALNGFEEKIRALTMKELTDAGMKKEAKELELLGARTAVVGELAYYYAPTMKVGKKDPQEWRERALQMRDNSVALAAAAQKGDAPGLLKASNSLNSSCSQCHSVFKQN